MSLHTPFLINNIHNTTFSIIHDHFMCTQIYIKNNVLTTCNSYNDSCNSPYYQIQRINQFLTDYYTTIMFRIITLLVFVWFVHGLALYTLSLCVWNKRSWIPHASIIIIIYYYDNRCLRYNFKVCYRVIITQRLIHVR